MSKLWLLRGPVHFYFADVIFNFHKSNEYRSLEPLITEGDFSDEMKSSLLFTSSWFFTFSVLLQRFKYQYLQLNYMAERTERIWLSPSYNLMQYCHKSKNLYNQANYVFKKQLSNNYFTSAFEMMDILRYHPTYRALPSHD